jgi:transposase
MVALVAPKSDAGTLGSERCGVVRLGAESAADTTQGWAWASLARHTCRVEWRVVGVGDRSTVARAAQQISPVPDVPSPVPTVGARRQTREDPAPTGDRVTSPRAVAAGGGVHRRLLHGGEKRGLAVGPTKRGKGTKILAICTDHSLPLAVGIQSASPHESQLVEEILGQSFLDELPERLIGDAAYDSDPLDDYLLKTYDIELIAPHKKNRKRLTQDGRPFRRYRRRWCVERLFAWLHWFRRLVIRWEYHAENFLGMVQLGCIKILLRHI